MQLLVALSTHEGEQLIHDRAGMARYFDVYRFTENEVETVESRK